MDLAVAVDFPKAGYVEVEERMSTYIQQLGSSSAIASEFSGYAGGWNGMIMRFRAADEERLIASRYLARQQGGLSLEDRYQQERALFGFFASAVSAVESCCFAIYHLGKMKEPSLLRKRSHEVVVNATAAEFGVAFPGSTATKELSALIADRDWINLKKIRNTLVHRESPGITFFASTVGAAPLPPAEWTDRGVVLAPPLVDDPRVWLGRTMTKVVAATLAFVQGNF